MKTVRAKKSLGQNFLKSKAIAGIMADFAQKEETIIEIGPGKGILTDLLLQKGARVIALEKDSRMIPLLAERFSGEIASGNLSVLETDALLWDPSKEAVGPYAVIANIPYYITGAVIRKFLENPHQPEHMTLLVQKEVAFRAAKDEKGSLLSVSMRAYGTPKYVKTVSRNLFSPVPGVDSAILHISGISRSRFKDLDEAFFFKVIKAGFAQKRKRLFSNLKRVARQETLQKAWGKLALDANVRAEDLTIEVWIALAKEIS